METQIHRGNHQRFKVSRSEWEKMEREMLAKYRRSLVHKARPMPIYKFFVPKPNLKPLTIPKSPNFSSKKIRTLQRRGSPEPHYSLNMPSFEDTPLLVNSEGGSFLDYSNQTFENSQESLSTTFNDETEEDMH